MGKTIAVLEDNDERVHAMDECLANTFPQLQRAYFRTAPDAIAWLDDHLSEAICIVLDHDLERPPNQPHLPDPGTAREVVAKLLLQPPACAVVIHTTNYPAAIAMETELQEHGWPVSRVTPYGDLQWISETWLPAVCDAIASAASGDAPAPGFHRA